jgi:hypothetical protein
VVDSRSGAASRISRRPARPADRVDRDQRRARASPSCRCRGRAGRRRCGCRAGERLAIRRPPGTAAQISVRGGASNLAFDAQRWARSAARPASSTPGWDAAPDRWSIELTGGASDLSVVEE